MSLGKCSCCGSDASTTYPLLPGSPSFCSSHHNERDAGRFGCDFSPPDWMDSVDFDGDEYDSDNTKIEERTWKTKDGRYLEIKEMTDDHVNNTFTWLMKTLHKLGHDDENLVSHLGAFAYEVYRRRKEKEK